MGTVTKMQSVVWSELADLCRKEQKHTADARALWPDIAARMAQLRRDYQSNEEFGAAVVQHGIEYNRNDRAAFVWMGSLKPAALEDAMARCERRSPQHFRGEVESWGDHYFDPCSSREEDATEAPVVTEPAENAPMAGETGAKAVLESVETGTGGPPKIDRRARLAELGEDGAWLYAVLAKDGREAVSPLVSKKHKPFLRFVIEKLKTGVIRPHISNSPVFHAGTLVNELHRSFSREMIFSRRGGDKPNAKAIGLFMEHFDLVQRAAELGWTYPDFLRATKGASMMKATSAAEVWARQPTSTTVTGELPKTASLQDGTELEPAPIFVCGVCLFPSEARKELRYVDAYMHAHDCRQLVSEMNTHSVKEIGMHLAHRGLQFAREYKDLGQFLSTIGTAIQSRGETMDRALWFKLEPFRNRTTT